MKRTVTLTGNPEDWYDTLDVPEDAQIEINGWAADSLEDIEPGTYLLTDNPHLGDEPPVYDIWFCTEDDTGEWRYLTEIN